MVGWMCVEVCYSGKEARGIIVRQLKQLPLFIYCEGGVKFIIMRHQRDARSSLQMVADYGKKEAAAVVNSRLIAEHGRYDELNWKDVYDRSICRVALPPGSDV